MKIKNQSFNDFVKNLPPLKQIDAQERLPQYFDMMWDIKYGYQLMEHLKYNNNPDIYSALARYGYDAKTIKQKKCMKYVKLTARKDTWFQEGTEAYHYDCDENDKYRISLEEWERDWLPGGVVLARGTRICENQLSENCDVGTVYFDGECCHIDEFDVEIVDEIN